VGAGVGFLAVGAAVGLLAVGDAVGFLLRDFLAFQLRISVGSSLFAFSNSVLSNEPN
jgi:hypothetical protein